MNSYDGEASVLIFSYLVTVFYSKSNSRSNSVLSFYKSFLKLI